MFAMATSAAKAMAADMHDDSSNGQWWSNGSRRQWCMTTAVAATEVETKTAMAASLMVPAATRLATEVRDSNRQQQQAKWTSNSIGNIKGSYSRDERDGREGSKATATMAEKALMQQKRWCSKTLMQQRHQCSKGIDGMWPKPLAGRKRIVVSKK